ncbi:MAG: metal-sulfur cluster assembly factor [Candidatus Hydrothermarchaeaceae archaeon]
MKDEVIKKLKDVIDPHTNTNIYDMGLISELKVSGKNVSLAFTPSSPYCPLGMQLALAIKKSVRSIKGIGKVDVTVKGYIGEKELNEKLRSM